MTEHVHGAHAAHEHEEPHLPHGSIWPFWIAIGVSVFGVTMIFNNGLGGWVPLLGIAAIVLPLLGWFREDHRWWWTNTGTGTHVPRAGTLLFIGSEVFLFGALFATYFSFKTAASVWPDAFHHGEPLRLPLETVAIFSLFLFASSWTIHKAEHHLKLGDHRRFENWWLATIVLGLVFLAGQVSEYYTLIVTEGQSLGGGSQFMTAFFLITGTHGLHVFGGLVVLTVMYIRARKGQFTATRHSGPESAALYWHFVDIVWILVLTVLYILPTFT